MLLINSGLSRGSSFCSQNYSKLSISTLLEMISHCLSFYQSLYQARGKETESVYFKTTLLSTIGSSIGLAGLAIARPLFGFMVKIKILENIYYNPVCHLACRILKKRFFLERTISDVDILEMTLQSGIVTLYPYHGHLPGF